MTRHGPGTGRSFDVVLVLSGGNALGAYQAGVYQALHDQDLLPDWIVGASAGAINGALITGSRPERRLDALRTFWRPGSDDFEGLWARWIPTAMETTRRTAAVVRTMALGRSGTFGPLMSSLAPWSEDRRALFETEQLLATLERLVDFDELNGGACRLTTTAVDLVTGEDVVFDTASMRIDARHVRASAALPVLFPPVEIDGRWLVDAGMSANLPLDPVLGSATARPMLCLAVDLLPLQGTLPSTLGEAASRAQDLMFAAQSRRTIARWQSVHANNPDVRITLVRLAYADQRLEVAGKAFDFSGPSVEQRWSAGQAAMTRTIERIEAGDLPIGQAGLTVFEPE